jgi:hypothetical protein
MPAERTTDGANLTAIAVRVIFATPMQALGATIANVA